MKHPLPLLLALAFFAASGSSQAATARFPEDPQLKPTKTLAYVTGGHQHQRLDLYLPEKKPGAAPQKRPLVLFIHGGGWAGADKTFFYGKWLLEHGFIVASADYRLSGDTEPVPVKAGEPPAPPRRTTFPAQIEDCKAAIRYLRAHADELGLDPAHIGVWGQSAGGHLVALLGVTGQTRRFDVGGHLDQSSAVQCVVDWCGPTDLTHYEGLPPDRLKNLDDITTKLLGGPVAENMELARAASPLFAVTAQAAPFLIMHSAGDGTVPSSQSRALHAALQKAGVESTLIISENAAHNNPEFYTDASNQRILEFFERHLKAPPAPAQP